MDDRHRDLATTLASQLGADPTINAVVLHGSVAAGTHCADSDLDLLLITDSSRCGHHTTTTDGIEVETIGRPSLEWTNRLRRPMPRWAYAWAEAQILYQKDSGADVIITEARQRLRDYRASLDHLTELAAFWRHVRPKLMRTLTTAPPTEVGYAQTLSLPRMVETLFAINDTVEPLAAHRNSFARLQALSHPPGLPEKLERLFGHTDPYERARAMVDLIDAVTLRLAEPD